MLDYVNNKKTGGDIMVLKKMLIPIMIISLMVSGCFASKEIKEDSGKGVVIERNSEGTVIVKASEEFSAASFEISSEISIILP